jgi:mycothiol synthase
VTPLEFRLSTEQDAQAVADLINAYDAAFVAEPENISGQDVLDWWRREGEPWGVFENDALVGFTFVRRRGERWDGDGYVHPRAFGRGVGAAIVDWVESRLVELGSPDIRIAIYRQDERAACLLRGRGFERIRTFYRMLIDLDSEPEPAVWPEGFAVSSISPGEEHDLYEALEDAFGDHWDHARRTFEEWMAPRQRLQHELCFLVRRGGEVAAAAECKVEDSGIGTVEMLGTRREYRRVGLGEALLRHAFRELYTRGVRQVALGVDSENPTGATRLYERVEMRVASHADLYAKDL